MGVESAIYALHDETDVVESYFEALERSHDRLLDVICASPVEIINFGENLPDVPLTRGVDNSNKSDLCINAGPSPSHDKHH